MKLKILSTIAAISATATSASSLTCGDVQALYQDGACCSANGQSCVKSLSIAAGSNGGLTLSNTGELNLDLTSITDHYDTTTVSNGKLAAKADKNVLNAVLNSGVAEIGNYVQFNQGLQSQGNAAFGMAGSSFTVHHAATFKDTSSVVFEAPVTFSAAAKLGKEAHKSSEYLPSNIGDYCPSAEYTKPDYSHGFRSRWNTGWGGAANGGWEMVLGAGIFEPYPTACVVREVVLGTAQLHTNGIIYASGSAVTSDSRIKKDIVDADIEDALQKVRDIELKEYSYNDPNREGEKTVGFIAQQVKEVYPDAISIDMRTNSMYNEAGEIVEIPDLHRVRKDKIFALHHGAIQSLDAKIAALEALDAKIAALEARLAALEPQPIEPQPTA